MILAADPGSVKTGLAVLREDGTLIWKGIIPTGELEHTLKEIMSAYIIDVFVIGNGTHHKEVKKRVCNWFAAMNKNIQIAVVNEKYTTEMGEAWFWKYNPPQGFKRLIPKGLRTVPVPIDDYVAWIIGCIYLGIVKEEDVKHKKI